jgi:hypothetical protein
MNVILMSMWLRHKAFSMTMMAYLTVILTVNTMAAEGCEVMTRGADSAPQAATIYHVTSLADDGVVGTLRDAVSQPGRRIVFDVAGEILLKQDLLIRVSYLTIDGATAPSPGILIRQTGVTTAIEGSGTLGEVQHIVIRHLSFDATGTPHGSEKDILGLDGERSAVHHILIEHCTGRSSGDGVFDIWGRVHDVANCLESYL